MTGIKKLNRANSISQTSITAIFIGLLVAMLVASLDQTIMATALPTIVGELNGVDQMLWVTTAYVLTATIVMPLYGKVGDLVGRKYLFIGALVLFVVGSWICGSTLSMMGLILGRGIQGIGGGGLMILSQAIIADVVPPRDRAKYMGVMGVVYVVPMAIGPLLGGLFTDYLGWRWCFWINLPLSAVAIVTAIVCLPKPKKMQEKLSFDIGGTILLTIALTSLILVTSWGGLQYAWNSPLIIALIITTVVAAVLFVVQERRAKEPLMPLSMFKNRNFIIATLAGMISMVGMMGVITYLPTYFQIVNGLSATAAGYMEIPLSVAEIAASIFAGFLVSKTGKYKKMMILSFIIMAISMGLLTLLTVDYSILVIGIFLFIFGIGIGLSFETLILVVQNEFPIEVVGTATAATNFFREIGTTLGASLVGAVFVGGLSDTLKSSFEHVGGVAALGIDVNSITPSFVAGLSEELHAAVRLAYNDALVPIFVFMLPFMVVALILMFFIKENPLATTVEDSGRMSQEEVPRKKQSKKTDIGKKARNKNQSKLRQGPIKDS